MQIQRLGFVLVLGSMLLLPGCRQAGDPADYTIPYGVSLEPPRSAPAAGGVAQTGAAAPGRDTVGVQAPGPEATSQVDERQQQQPPPQL
jgi:hypothetical protein